MHKPLLPGLAAVLVVFAGCTMAPQYKRPASPVATTYPENDAPGAINARTADTIAWREFFTDPRLNRLIDLALASNRDLRVATLRVEQARAQYHVQRAELWPEVEATGKGSRSRTPGDLNTSGRSIITEQYSVGLGTTAYELDFFGRVRSLKNRALETYLATEEAGRAARLALVAQVATQYFSVLQLEEQVSIARRTLDALSSSYEVRRRSYEIGALGELDLRTADIQVQSARVSLASFTRLRSQAENTLIELVGQPLPEGLPMGRWLHEQGLLATLPAGVPSDLLLRRPDILAAEHTLKAANASIGAARAAFFPAISLTGSYGTASMELDGLFKNGSNAWNFTPSISLPIFAGGSNRANLTIATLAKQIEIANYEKAIQAAFREVSDALSARRTFREQIEAQETLVEAQQRRQELAEMRYRTGVDNYLAVLLAQQDLYSAQQALVQSRAAELVNLVTLYKALGGGWDALEKTASGRAVARRDR